MDCLLETRCLELARELCKGYADQRPPFPFDGLLERFGITAVRERPLDRDARLVRQSGKLVIEVNSLYPQARQRFSIAHELGHLIVDRCSATPDEHWGKNDPTIETLCDRLASEILSPDWELS